MVNDLCKGEFRPKFIRVEHHKPEQFVQCQWQNSQDVNIVYFVYRLLMAAIFLIVMICSICDAGRSADFGVKYVKWGIYLTNWGYTICTLQAVLAAGLLTQQFIQERTYGNYACRRKKLPVGYKVYWVCHTVSVVTALGVTVCYWTTVYNPDHELDGLNVLVHAFNSIFMIMDFLLVSHPFRLLHCYWPFLFTIVYIIFNLIYFELGGTDRNNRSYIYPLLDWQRPQQTLLAAACGLVFVVVLHCFIWVLFLLRRWLALSLSKKYKASLNGDISIQPTKTSIVMDVIDC